MRPASFIEQVQPTGLCIISTRPAGGSSGSSSILTCSCSGLLDAPEFLSLLRAAARKANRSVQLLAMTGASADHPVALDAPESSYLKVAWLRIGERLPDEIYEPGA